MKPRAKIGAMGWWKAVRTTRREHKARQLARTARIETLEARTLLAGPDFFPIPGYEISDVWEVPGVRRGTGIVQTSVAGWPADFSVSYSVALGDFDGDDDLDAFVANGFDIPDQVLLNDGNGDFVSNGQTLGHWGSLVVELGDVDGDDDLDAVTATGEGLKLWLGDGNGQFTLSTSDFGATISVDVKLGDLDGDNDLDLFATDAVTMNRVWLNDGGGNYSLGETIDGVPGLNHSGVALVDINNDDALDALVTGIIGETVYNSAFLNDGSGHFLGQQTIPQTAAFDILSGDIDGDQDSDVVIVGVAGAVSWINDGSGTMVEGNPVIGAPGIPARGSLADVDGDTDLDIVMTVSGTFSENQTGTQILLNTGDGSFVDSGQNLGAKGGSYFANAIGDLTGDNHADMFLVGMGQYQILTTTGDGVFNWLTDPPNRLIKNQNVELADFDGDGDLDVFNLNNEVASILLNDGQGRLTDTRQTISTNETWVFSEFVDVALGDFDGDDDIDAFLVSGMEDSLIVVEDDDPFDSVWLNDGNGVFTDSGQRLGPDVGVSVRLADLDGDDDLDAFVGNEGANKVWFNVGGGLFSESDQSFPNDTTTREIALGDLDGDGDIDAFEARGPNIFAIDDDDNVGVPDKVWLNNGRGKFTVTAQNLGLSRSNRVELGDVDGDGDLDAVVGSFGADYSRNDLGELWLNDGAANFAFANSTGVVGKSSLELGDLDDDGNVDVLHGDWIVTPGTASGGAFGFIHGWINDGSGAFSVQTAALLGVSGALGDMDGDTDLDVVALGYPFGASVWFNQDGQFGQRDPSIAVAPDGRFVVAYESDGGDKDESAIFAQRYAADGSPVGDLFRVNADARFRQEEPVVVMDETGKFVVVWTSAEHDGDEDGIYARWFDADGTPMSDDILVNFGGTVGWQYFPDMASDSSGNLVITWADQNATQDRVMAQRYRADGVTAGLNFPVNTTHPGAPKVAFDPDDNFAIVWEGELDDVDGYGIYLQRFMASGEPFGSDELVGVSNRFRGSADTVDLAYNEAGDLMVTWHSDNLGAGSSEILGRGYDSTGVATDLFVINTGTAGEQSDPTIVSLPRGSFMVTWLDELNTNHRIVAQQIGPSGNRIESEVELQATGELSRPAIAAHADGKVPIAWQSRGELLLDGTASPTIQARTLVTANYDFDASALASMVSTSDVMTTSSFQLVASSNAKLDAWIDFNQDGNWTASEQIAKSTFTNAGKNVLSFAIPASASVGETTARFRLSADGNLSPSGDADVGELKDYAVSIVDGSTMPNVHVQLIDASSTLKVVDGKLTTKGSKFDLFAVPINGMSKMSVVGSNSDEVVTLDSNGGTVIPPSGLVIDAREGHNTLRMIGVHMDFDLTSDGNVVGKGLNEIDLSDSNIQQVTMDLNFVSSMAATDRLLVIGGIDDRIVFDDADDWRMGTTSIVDGKFIRSVHHVAGGGESIDTDFLQHWRNVVKLGDVNNNGKVTALDALIIINELHRRSYSNSNTGELKDPLQVADWPGLYFDHTGDGRATALDALRVINELAVLFNADGQLGEGDFAILPLIESIEANSQRNVPPIEERIEISSDRSVSTGSDDLKTEIRVDAVLAELLDLPERSIEKEASALEDVIELLSRG